MSLQPGTRLGPYEITAQIGVGGMGEVYRATQAPWPEGVLTVSERESPGLSLARTRTTQGFSGVVAAAVVLSSMVVSAQEAPSPNWGLIEAETMEHFQALLRLDTSNPPGNETAVVEYLESVLEAEGIAVEIFALEPARANLVARLRGNGSKRPLLLVGYTDVVSVDPTKWTHPPFGAVRDGGYVYGRGALDDKDNLVVSLMVMLTLKRLGLPLARDVIFLAEAGEEGTTRPGIDFMVGQHFPAIDAEYCLAEGGGVRREAGQITFGSVGTLEKIPRTIELRASGPSGHGSVPLGANAIGRLAAAGAAASAWQAPIRLNDTTREYFRRLAEVSDPAEARRFRTLLDGTQQEIENVVACFLENAPGYAAVLRNSVSPTILQGGFRYNVIPSEAPATLDVRLLPDEDPDAFVEELRRVINDPAVEVALAERDGEQRPAGGTGVDNEAFRAIEMAMTTHCQTVTIPAMSTGASDKAQMRAQGVQCYGIGPLADVEDGVQGFSAHGDQERILEVELYRFVRFTWDVVASLAAVQ